MPAGKRIDALDGVRGFAVLAVLVFHTLPVPDAPSGLIVTAWNALAQSCWVGVDMFFVLSGFLITRALCAAKGKPRFFSDFYVSRILRIVPIYIAVLLAALYIVPLLIPAEDLPSLYSRLIKNQLWLWAFLQNYIQAKAPHQLPGFGHFWTLAVEEQFYVVWPAVVLWFSRRWLVGSSLAICAVEPLARYFFFNTGYSAWAIRQLTFLRVDALLAGALVYLLFVETVLTPRAMASMRVIAIAAGAVVLWMLARYKSLPYESQTTAIIGYSAVAIVCASLLRVCLNDGLVAQFFSGKVLRWFGKYSYAIYIFSVPAILCFQALIGDRISRLNPFLLAMSRLLFSGAASVACALASWSVIEHPALNLKSRFISGHPIRPLAPALSAAK
jgi:peptidoglycan/LPS O-acetylase OafA/YrhL